MFDLDKLKSNNAIFWTFLLPSIRKAAYECGWAIGIHGSFTNDLDLMAMPWVENHSTADDLASVLQSIVDDKGRVLEKHENDKPCNRIVYTIFAGNSYIDLNVIKER